MEKQVDFLTEAMKLQEQMVVWRRQLHQIPEVGIHLPKTMEYLKKQLEEMEIPYECYEDISCIVAVLGTGDRCFLLRSDVDGLAMTEETDLDFKSVNGCMHGCGHDMHGAILLGAARLLKNREKELQGTVKLLFQSGEEVFQGARAAIKAGVLENPPVEAAFAAHVIAMLPMGVVLTGKKPMASVDSFRMVLKGKGGHGSMPEMCIDPINAGVQVYLALQSLLAREIAGTQEATLTIGQFQAGEGANIIPQRAMLSGTLRTFDEEVRHHLLSRIGEISEAVAAAYRCSMEYRVLSSCPGVVTDDDVTVKVEEGIRSLSPQVQMLQNAHGMGSEDFAEIASKVPSAYYMLGAAPKEEKKRFGQHNPKVEFNEEVLAFAAAIYAKTAYEWVGEERKEERDERNTICHKR